MASLEPNSQVLEEVKDLRDRLESLAGASAQRYKIALEYLRAGEFLGQPVVITAKVFDGARELPQTDVPVTFITTWGRLRVKQALNFCNGNAVTVRTGADGAATVTLEPPTCEELWDAQQSALATMLQALDESASTPLETEAGLKDMVYNYRWEANLSYRQAVDIHLESFRPGLLDRINSRDFMQEWLYFDSAVIAYAFDGDREGKPKNHLDSVAAITFRFKDWLPAWLQTYLDICVRDNTLESDMRHLSELGEDEDALIDYFYRRTYDFLSNERGLAGEWVGCKVAQILLVRLIDSGITDLPLDAKVRLSQAIPGALNALSHGSVTTMTDLIQNRAELRQEIDKTINNETQGAIEILINSLNTSADSSLHKFDKELKEASNASLKEFEAELENKAAEMLEVFKSNLTFLKLLKLLLIRWFKK